MTPTREMANNAKMVAPLQDDDHPITKRDLREMEARLEEALKATMAPMQVLINNLTSKVEALENKNQMQERIIEQYREENARVNKKLDELVNQMEAEHNEMKIKQADLEDRNRRCNIRFRNFPEKTEEKSPADLIIRWLKNTIPSLKLEAEDLERAHRALKPMPKPSAPPPERHHCMFHTLPKEGRNMAPTQKLKQPSIWRNPHSGLTGPIAGYPKPEEKPAPMHPASPTSRDQIPMGLPLPPHCNNEHNTTHGYQHTRGPATTKEP
ncbi:uncharacterized protein LOC144325112 [Podarcis muralis]